MEGARLRRTRPLAGVHHAAAVTCPRPRAQFGVTAANDELDAVGSSFVQLMLSLQRTDGCAGATPAGVCACEHHAARSCRHSACEDVQFELTLPQFYSLLRSLEQVLS